MKCPIVNRFFFFLALFTLSLNLFSEDFSFSLSGFYSNYSQDSSYEMTTETLELESLGLNIKATKPLKDSPWSIYISWGIYFPQEISFSDEDGSNQRFDLQNDVDSSFAISALFGPGYTAEIGKNLYLVAGLGYVFNWFYMDDDLTTYSLLLNGFGADFTLRYQFNDSYFVEVGSGLTLQVYGREKVTNSGSTQIYSNNNMSSLEIRPFVGFGINLGD